tara:strand:+ start:377 stop:1447 length:1071 start_codon:yes stop_codon:yes gene_type:complete
MSVRVSKPEFNLREKISELDKPIGLKGNELLKSETAQEARDLVSAGRKNYIINGDFQISQRGTYTTATAIANQTYYLDRWTVDVAGVSGTIRLFQTQAIGTSGDNYYKNYVQMLATSTATGYLQLRQFIEIPKSLVGKVVTVSAWVKSNNSNVRLRCESGNFGGTNWDSYQSHSGHGGWEKLSMTIRLATNLTSLKFGVILWGSTGGPAANHAQGPITVGDYYEFTDYQVELGENATDFEHRSFAEELSLCQRYFYKNTDSPMGLFITDSADSGKAYGIYRFPVPMRATPNIVLSDNNGNSDGKVTQHGAAHNLAATASQIQKEGFSRVLRTGSNFNTSAAMPIVCGVASANAELT